MTPIYEYKMVETDELTAHGMEGWRIIPGVPPVQGIKIVLGQPQPGPLSWLMERQVGE